MVPAAYCYGFAAAARFNFVGNVSPCGGLGADTRMSAFWLVFLGALLFGVFRNRIV